jgi:hypothetical protein
MPKNYHDSKLPSLGFQRTIIAAIPAKIRHANLSKDVATGRASEATVGDGKDEDDPDAPDDPALEAALGLRIPPNGPFCLGVTVLPLFWAALMYIARVWSAVGLMAPIMPAWQCPGTPQ